MICFAGSYEITIDSKRRINIPSACMMELFMDTNKYKENPEEVNAAYFKLFKESGPFFHITKGRGPYLVIDPRETFRRKAERIHREFGSRNASRDEHRYMHEIMNNAQPVRCDKQGRITVSPEQLEYAGIKENAIVVGMFDFLEVWDPEKYKEYMNGGTSDPEDRLDKYSWVERQPDAVGPEGNKLSQTGSRE